MVSKYYLNTIPVTCFRVLNSSPGRLDLGGLGFKYPRWGTAYMTGARQVIHHIGSQCSPRHSPHGISVLATSSTT